MVLGYLVIMCIVGLVIAFIIAYIMDDDRDRFTQGIVFTLGVPFILFVLFSAVWAWAHW